MPDAAECNVDASALPTDRPVDWQGEIVPMIRSHRAPGTAWLAGYPRSGATLIRTIMANCFGHCTSSIYTEQRLTAAYSDALGHLPEGATSLDDVRTIAHEQRLLLFKTHMRIREPEEIDAIVIVRDARRVFSSLRAFYHERVQTPHTMEQVIAGRTSWGDWSAWIKSWVANCSPRTMWLRYEDVMVNRHAAIDRIAQHFGIEPAGYDIPDFAVLNKDDPTIFRVAENEGNGGMTDAQEDMFWTLHGPVMNMLGYYRD